MGDQKVKSRKKGRREEEWEGGKKRMAATVFDDGMNFVTVVDCGSHGFCFGHIFCVRSFSGVHTLAFLPWSCEKIYTISVANKTQVIA